MRVRGITKTDFDYVIQVFDRWWGGPASERAHPVYFYELGAQALIAEDEPSGEIIGFLLGFHTPDGRTGYVHLVGIHPEHRRRGVGKELYLRFQDAAKRAGCVSLKAITNVGHEGSVHFHEALGFAVTEDPSYAGPNRPRIVFTKAL